MKKLLFAILAAFIIAGSFPASAQFRFGATAGIDMTNLIFKQPLVPVDQSVGYSAGVMGELIFPGIGFGIDVGLGYQQRGATVGLGKCKIWSSEGYGRERVYLHYLQIPIHFRFKYTRLGGLEDYIAPFVYGGPEFGVCIGHGSISRNGESAFDYSGGDLGLTAGVGFEIMRNWQLSGSYTWGMTYMVKTRLLDNFSARGRSWDVKLTYFF